MSVAERTLRTHLALINAVVHLIQAELREKRGFPMAHQIVT